MIITKEEYERLKREAPSQDSDVAEPVYVLRSSVILPLDDGLPLFLARVMVRELKAQGIEAHIEVR